MNIKWNIEAAGRVGPDGDWLFIKGWAFAESGAALTAIRLVRHHRAILGYYGVPRPDVVKAFGGDSNRLFSGFSFLEPRSDTLLPGSIEVEDREGHWHKITDLTSAQHLPLLPATAAGVELSPLNSPGQPLSAKRIGAGIGGSETGPVLFISHDFASAGAQLLLLRMLQWLRANGSFRFEILVAVPRSVATHASDAEKHVLAGFEACAPVHFLSDLTQAPENLPLIRDNYYQLIYANTSTLGWMLPSLRPFSCPVISHVHELGFWIERRTGMPIFERQMAHSDRIIACSTPVRDYLIRDAGVPPEKLVVIHACGSMERARKARQDYSRETVRRELGIAAETFVVAACGTFDWRKGAELFVPICVALGRKLVGRDFRAMWIGDYGSPLIRDQFAHEVKIAGLVGKVELLGPQREPLRLML